MKLRLPAHSTNKDFKAYWVCHVLIQFIQSALPISELHRKHKTGLFVKKKLFWYMGQWETPARFKTEDSYMRASFYHIICKS